MAARPREIDLALQPRPRSAASGTLKEDSLLRLLVLADGDQRRLEEARRGRGLGLESDLDPGGLLGGVEPVVAAGKVLEGGGAVPDRLCPLDPPAGGGFFLQGANFFARSQTRTC